jgi:DNA (cytosine-5)-methyltransferase 1
MENKICKSINKLNKNKIEINNLSNNNIKLLEKINYNFYNMNPDLLILSKINLLKKCKELNITKYSSKNKSELINMINVKILNNKEQIIFNNQIEEKINTYNKEETYYKFIDLFCGIGGFHLALNKINAKCVYACDKDENCRKIYEKNFGLKPEGDITQINISNIPKFDILCAGFPCQPFSKAGLKNGFEDYRGNLFFYICDIIKYHKPKYIILENVKNLSSHDNGNTWKVIKEHIDILGYETYSSPVILNVLHFNVPQNRERVIIMCIRKDLGQLSKLPNISKNPKINLTQNIKNFIMDDEININKKYKIDGKMKDVEIIWDEFIKLLIFHKISIPKFPIWTDWWDKEISSNDLFYNKYTNWIDKNIEFYNKNILILNKWLSYSRKCNNWIGAVRKFEWQAGDLLENDSMNNVLWTARGSGIRVKRLNYIPTLVAMNMIPIYGPESRKLSPRELLRLQSFPNNYIYDEKTIFKQVGNAVNVLMIERCVRFFILNENLF